MKNLENYGVQELNANEFREIDGGSWGWAWKIAKAVYQAVEYGAENAEATYGHEVDNPHSFLK